MHHAITNAFEQIDAAIFNSDTFDEPEDLAVLKDYLERWQKHLHNEAIANRAVLLGCEPEWADGIAGWAWHCTCPDSRHGADQQCSMITSSSLIRETNKQTRGGTP